MPIEAGCGSRLTATLTVRFFASATRSSIRWNGLFWRTKMMLSSTSSRQKYW